MQLHRHLDLERYRHNRWGIDWFWITRPLAAHLRRPLTVCEIGIGPLRISALPWLAGTAAHLVGVDPVREFVDAAREALPDARIVHAAVCDRADTTVRISVNGGSSAIMGAWCPTRGGARIVEVPAVRMSQIDDGTVDVLNIDCEGAEHHVLAHLVSAPAVIGIELWPQYPKRGWCLAWLREHEYRPIIETGPESETSVWVHCPMYAHHDGHPGE